MQQVAPVPSLAGAPPAPPPTITHLPHTHLFCSPASPWSWLPAGHGAPRESHRCALRAAHAPLGREEKRGRGRACARGCGVQQLHVLSSSDVHWGEGGTLLFGVPASSLLRFSPGRQCLPHATVVTFRAWSRRTRQNCALFNPFAWILVAQVAGSTSCKWCVRQARAKPAKKAAAPCARSLSRSVFGGSFRLSWPRCSVPFGRPFVPPPSLPLFLRSTGSAWFTSEFLCSETIMKCERCAVCNIFLPVLVLVLSCVSRMYKCLFLFFLLQVFFVCCNVYTTNLNLCHMITVFSFVYFLLKILSHHS